MKEPLLWKLRDGFLSENPLDRLNLSSDTDRSDELGTVRLKPIIARQVWGSSIRDCRAEADSSTHLCRGGGCRGGGEGGSRESGGPAGVLL